MQMMLKDGQLYIRQLDDTQYQIIKSWNKMKWSRQNKMLIGPADYDLLERLSRMCKLPPNIEAERKRMEAVQIAVDKERMNEHPEPLVHYPVKMKLFDHQCRGANMALLTFGIIKPEELTNAKK